MPMTEENKMTAYTVTLNEKEIDIVFANTPNYATRAEREDDIKRGLVGHDGYDPTIVVTEERPTPHCDMAEDCDAPVTHIDRKGFAYCTEHGQARREYQPCRRLRDWELRKLQRGETLRRY